VGQGCPHVASVRKSGTGGLKRKNTP